MINYKFLVLDLLAILFQFTAAYFGFRIYRFNRLSPGWLAVVLGFIIQGLRRTITLLVDVNYLVVSSEAFESFDRLMAMFISVLMVVGILSMLRSFESFEVVCRKGRDVKS